MHRLTGLPGGLLVTVNMAGPPALSAMETVPVLNELPALDVCALNADQVAPLAITPMARAEATVTMPLVRSLLRAPRCRPRRGVSLVVTTFSIGTRPGD